MNQSVLTKINRIKTKLREPSVDAALLRFELSELQTFIEKFGIYRVGDLLRQACNICVVYLKVLIAGTSSRLLKYVWPMGLGLFCIDKDSKNMIE